MKKVNVFFAFALIFLLFGCIFPLPQPTPTPQTGNISVIAVNSETNAPISGANVSIPNKQTNTTDYAGKVFFNNLAPGTYAITIRKEGYSAATANASVTVGQTSENSIALQPIKAAWQLEAPSEGPQLCTNKSADTQECKKLPNNQIRIFGWPEAENATGYVVYGALEDWLGSDHSLLNVSSKGNYEVLSAASANEGYGQGVTVDKTIVDTFSMQGVIYCYKIKSKDLEGESKGFSPRNCIEIPVDGTVNFTATPGNSQIVLKWGYENAPSNFYSYKIYRSTEPDFAPCDASTCTSNSIKEIKSKSTKEFTDAEVINGTHYYYKIKVSVKKQDNSLAYSLPASGDAIPVSPAPRRGNILVNVKETSNGTEYLVEGASVNAGAVTTSTDSAGQAVFENLAIGNYTITASKEG